MLDLSVIIPFKDKASMTIKCLDTLLRYSDDLKEVLLVSNNSTDRELAAVQKAADKYPTVKVVVYNHPFNYQKINNWAAKQATGQALLLLNNDIELTADSAGLLTYMHDKALLAENGAVGCVLLYEGGKSIQHAGVYLVAGGTADHLYIGKSLSKVQRKLADSSLKLPNINHDLRTTAVTAAALVVEKAKFDKVGGFNENFIIGGGDVDLCLRLDEAGFKSLLVGASHGTMIHKESKSRSMLSVPYVDFVESYKSYVRHFDIAKGDPYISAGELQHVR